MRGTLRIMAMAVLLGGGCVERTLTIKSDPPQALVSLNGMEMGRTPYQRDFTFYGFYDVELRQDGYETLRTRGKVIAPWWQWPPIDLLAELLPFRLHDRQELSFALKPLASGTVSAEELLGRGEAMQGKLETSEHTRSPASQPTARP